MDNNVFSQALLAYQRETTLLTCRPAGLFLTNTGSEKVEFSLNNLTAPPLQLIFSETSESFDNMFKLRSYSPEKQEEITAVLLGRSKENRLIALEISNAGLCAFHYAAARPDATDEDLIQVHQIPLDVCVKHLRLRIDRGPDAAYYLEQDFFNTTGSTQTAVRHVLLTEIVENRKTRRFEHTHIGDGRRTSPTWHITRYSTTPT